MNPRVRVKICCIASVEEARLAVSCGADALGLVARMPSGPGPIPDDLIREIAATVPPPIATFLLTSETEPAPVVDHVRRTEVNTVQLVDDEISPDVHRALRRETPAVRIVQVLHVRGRDSIDKARQASERVDAILLDSGNPDVRELGGTGRTHDWGISREIVQSVGVPVFLAGGLKPGNVADAIDAVRPFGVDLCTGVRTDGRLNRDKLAAFMASMYECQR